MPNRTLLRLTLLAMVGSMMLQLGCDNAETAKQKELVENLKGIGEDLHSNQPSSDTEAGGTDENHDTKPEGSSEAPPANSATTQTPVPPTLEGPVTPEQAPVVSDDSEDSETEEEKKKRLAQPTIEITENWTRLSKDREVWIDKKAKQVMFAGRICLTAGQLEMFICPEGTKEHESVISSSALASEIHMALLLIDCKPGKASAWDPEYRPAHGPSIEANIKWRDEDSGETKSRDAKQMIRDVDTQKAMAQRWIFGGSEFWKDPDTGEEVYYGDSGELVCLSNFSTATIDVDVKSSQANDGLLFEAFTQNIPPVGTKVYTILTPGEVVQPEVKKPKKESDKPEPKEDETQKSESAESLESKTGDNVEPDSAKPDSAEDKAEANQTKTDAAKPAENIESKEKPANK